MAKFRKIISLGPSCETAYQIRQIVEQEEAYVFDWVIASAASVARVIATDFAELVRPSFLHLSNRDGQVFVTDALTRIEFHHDFKNDNLFLETLAEVQDKYNFLVRRTRELMESSFPILFIHHSGTRDDAYHLDAVLADRYPALNFELVELTCGGEYEICRDGRIVFASIPGHGTCWQERTPQWLTVLKTLLSESFDSTIKQREPATWDPVPASSQATRNGKNRDVQIADISVKPVDRPLIPVDL